MALLLFYILLALGISFLCSIMEAVLLSITPSYVAAQEQDGQPLGQRLRVLKDDIDRPLAAILSLNTIAHTLGAAGAGAQATAIYGDAYLGIISAILTLLILVLSEIIPKTLGALYWRQLAGPVTRLLEIIITLLYPLVIMSKGITRLLSRGQKKESVSLEEFTALAELGAQQGVFEAEESRIIKNLVRFRSLRVKDIMTPRTVLFAMPEDKMVFEVMDEHSEFRFSRIPIFAGNRDTITGYVLKDDILLRAAQEDDEVTLRTLKREIQVVPDNVPLPDLLERLLDKLEHVALVVDEYGGVAGLVTMEDVVETLLGMEIVDEVDSVEDMQELARQEWLRRAKRLGLVVDEAEVPPMRLETTHSAPPEAPPIPEDPSTEAPTSSSSRPE
ncbi:MAG: hemolysin family protein [Bacteroidota bacterium]